MRLQSAVAALLACASISHAHSVLAQTYGPYSTGSFDNTATAAATAPTTTVREVATRAWTSIDAFPGSAGNSVQTRTEHVARVAITKLAIAAPNFWVHQSFQGTPGAPLAADTGNQEYGFGATSTVTAAVEYPAGTFTRITFGGATSGTIPDKSVLVSDEVAVTIPKGAHFFVRMHLVNVNGVPDTYYTTTTSAVNYGPNDAATFGTNVSDQTMGGTVAATVAGVVVFPSAIVGPSNAPAVCLHADSRGAGIHPAPASLDNGNSLIAVGEVFPYINLEMPGETAAQAVASYAVRASLEQFCTADVMAYGINDLYGGATPAALEASVDTMTAGWQALGHPVVLETLPPETTSTDGWTTSTNQTKASWDANRVAYDAWVRSYSATGQTGMWDVAGAVMSGFESGVWLPTFPQSDGVHETFMANAIEATVERPADLSGNN